MLSKLSRFYRLYHNAHFSAGGRPFPLIAPDGAQLGYVDCIQTAADKTRIDGWAVSEDVALRPQSGAEISAQRAERPDVIAAFSNSLAKGFSASGPTGSDLVLREDNSETRFTIPTPKRRAILAAHLRVLADFSKTTLSQAPKLLRSAANPSIDQRAEIKRAFGLIPKQGLATVDTGFFSVAPHDEKPGNYWIIIPVFNAPEMLRVALSRISRNSLGNWHAIVIDDASTDPRVAKILSSWARRNGPRVTLRKNDRNLGFLATVNSALCQIGKTDDPVVLLNTDAWVPKGWDARLLSPLKDPQVASVTPLSNNAEIFSVPSCTHPSTLRSGQVDYIDGFAKIMGAPRFIDAPTAVGFAMALSPRWLARFPQLDPVFGQGYGEEVDWCQKTKAKGARHVCQHRLFIQHAGSSSFGANTRAKKVAAASNIIAQRYPAFDRQVQNFITEDPLATPRFVLAVALARGNAKQAVPIFLAHSMGGGAEIALEREIADHCMTGGAAIVLRVGSTPRWQLEIHHEGNVSAIGCNEFEQVVRLLAPIDNRHVIYSCGVGDPDPIALPSLLVDLAKGGRLSIRVHDYFIADPTCFLLDNDGVFSGIPSASSQDLRHHTRRPNGQSACLKEWQNAWGGLVGQADEITVFSKSSAALIGEAYPESISRIVLRPHKTPALPNQILPSTRARKRIGVLGNLSIPKGAGVLCQLATPAESNHGLKFVAFGSLDPAVSPPAELQILGGYQVGDIVDLAMEHEIGAWLIPSICPETFSFATREALATGLPVLGFDLGAQAEALKAMPNGFVVPLRRGRADISLIHRRLRALLGPSPRLEKKRAA